MTNNINIFKNNENSDEILANDFYNPIENNSKNINYLVNIILSRLNKSNAENIDFVSDIRDWLEEKKINWRNEEDIINVFKRIFTKVSVPWLLDKNWRVRHKTNLDSKASIFLLKKAGFNIEQIFYQKNHSKTRNWFINLDLWNYNWLNIEWFEPEWLKSFFSDSAINLNHRDRKISSTTHMVFMILDELGLFNNWEKEQIKRFISFIDLKDNSFNVYWINSDYNKPYMDSYRTLFWLSDMISIDSIFDYFNDEKNGLEVLNLDELKKIDFKDLNNKNISWLILSERRRKFIWTSVQTFLDKLESNSVLKYNNQKLDFVIDLSWDIVNPLEVSSFNWKWLIKIHNNWDIMIFNPKWFSWKFSEIWFNKWHQISFIKIWDPNYYLKLEKLLELLSWDKTNKINILNYVSYEWDLLKSLKPKVSKEYLKKKKEADKILKKKKKLRENRTVRHINTFKKQNFFIEDLKEKMVVNWKIFDISNKARIYVDIKLDPSIQKYWEVYVTPTRLKEKTYSMNKIITNKMEKNKEDRENIIYSFKIINIDTDSNRISLRQI